ncbi:MAG: hypothetical protein Q9179_001436 [Wetmoreana sp. 5 TL-2023]
MKQLRKRERQHDPDSPEPVSKHRPSRLEPSHQEESTLPTPAPTAPSPEQPVESSFQPRQTPSNSPPEAGKQSNRPKSEPNRPKRALEEPNCDQSAAKRRRQSPAASDPQAGENHTSESRAGEPQGNWFVDCWLAKSPQSRAVREKVKGIDVLAISEAEGNVIQTWDVEDERGDSDNFGIKIPREVYDLVIKHIRKERKSPRLDEEEKAGILRKIEVVWDSPEPRVSDIIAPPLFPFDDLNPAPSLAQSRGILWSSKPLPRNAECPLATPKTDRHLGYQTTLKSSWARQELAAADQSKVWPYSQPTRGNLFPSFLVEIKSEATGGTLYGAEAQLATAGFHRVSSLLWVLDQIDPNRSRTSGDAIVFSAAVTQRQATAHVHYYNPDDDTYYMSFIDSYYYAKDVQGCRDFGKNVEDWLLEIQQPVVREALKALHPITQLWKKARSFSAVADDAGSSFGSDSGRPTKSERRV